MIRGDIQQHSSWGLTFYVGDKQNHLLSDVSEKSVVKSKSCDSRRIHLGVFFFPWFISEAATLREKSSSKMVVCVLG